MTEHPRRPQAPILNSASLAGIPRIDAGVDFVQRWEPNALLTGLVSGARAHAILLALVRRLTQDRPPDLNPALARLFELQQFLNALGGAADGVRAPELDLEAFDACVTSVRTLIERTEPVIQAIQAPGLRFAPQKAHGSAHYRRTLPQHAHR